MAVINLGSRINIDNKKTIMLPGIKDKKFTIILMTHTQRRSTVQC